MAGDVVVSDDLYWAASGPNYRWVLDFLHARAQRPVASAAVAYARDTGIGILDLSPLPVEDRDELYDLLSEGLVPEAMRIGRHLNFIEELADLATSALARHRGAELAGYQVKLDTLLTWPCGWWYSYQVRSFLRSMVNERLAAFLDAVAEWDPHVLSLATMAPADRLECLEAIRDELVSYAELTLDAEPIPREHVVARFGQLADLARQALQPEPGEA